MHILCRWLAWHNWKIIQEEEYESRVMKRLGIPTKYKTRECTRCGHKQYQNIHCLGLKPPEYIRTWLPLKDGE